MTDPADTLDPFLCFICALREVDPDITASEIADTLFLSERLGHEHIEPFVTHLDDWRRTETVDAQPDAAADVTPLEPAGRVGGDGELAGEREAAGAETRTSNPSQTLPAGLYADVAAVTGQRARRVRAPTGRALSDPLGVARALRPLMRRAPSRTQLVLDVDATVQHVAESQLSRVRFWSPVQRPLAERWLSVDLVVDASTSMAPWSETIAEFHGLLERSGGFRTIGRWDWDTRNGRFLARELSRATRAWLPGEPGARVALVLTDCLSEDWRNGRALGRVAAWGQINPAAIVQMLPEHLWSRSALADQPQAVAYHGVAGTPNLLLQHTALTSSAEDLFALLDSLDAEPAGDGATDAAYDNGAPRLVPIPVVTLDPARLLPWARMVAGRAGPPVRAVLAPAISTTPTITSDTADGAEADVGSLPAAPVAAAPPALDDEMNARRLVESFRGFASQGARRLAVYLTAVAPITLSVMRVIRDALIPAPSEAQIAELLMSGFFRELPAASANERAYDWVPAVQQQLSYGLTASDFARVSRAVTAWINERTGSPREMTALTPDPSGAERLVMTDETRPFAYLYADNLRRLNRNAEAERLEDRAAKHADMQAPRGLDLQREFRGSNGVIFRMAWSPDGRYLVTPSVDGSIQIWDAATGQLIQRLDVSREGINEIAWLLDQTQFAAACHDGFLRIWEVGAALRSVELVREIGPHQTDIRCVSWSPNGQSIAIGCENGLIRSYAPTGEVLRDLAHLAVAVPVVAWSPDGILAAGALDGVVRYFRPSSESKQATRGGRPGVMALGWSPRGGVAAYGDYDGNLMVHDPAGSSGPRAIVRGSSEPAHDDTISALAFSPDGSVLASKGMDGFVRFWRADTWVLMGELPEPSSNFVLSGLAWQPRGPLFASLGDRDRSVRMWQANMERLLPVPVVLPSARREPRAPDVRQASDSVAGGLPYWEAPFDEHGERIGRDLVVRLLRGLQLEHVTDLLVFCHGWNSDRVEARALYAEFFKALETLLPMAHVPPGTQFGALGVLWPSKAWTDDEAEESTSSREGAAEELSDVDLSQFQDRPGGGGFVSLIWNGLKNFGRTGTYYLMRNRAKVVGRDGLGPFLGELADLNPDLRIHLIAHSVGARVAAYALAGLPLHRAAKAVKSLILLQPVLSHFAFSSKAAPGKSNPLARSAWEVDGPVIVTYSRRDTVPRVYELAARLAGDDDDVPGMGSEGWKMMGYDGAQGVSAALRVPLGPVGQAYSFPRGQIVNVDVEVVLAGHSDIRRQEIAWLVASTVLSQQRDVG